MPLALLAFAACLAQPAVQPVRPTSYVVNGRFNGSRGWDLATGHSIVQRAPGDRCLFATQSASHQIIWRRASWSKMSAAVDIRVESITAEKPGGFAYAAIYQYDNVNHITKFADFIHIQKPTAWKRYTYTFDVAPATTMIFFNLGFYNAHGKAYFDNATLVEGDRAMSTDEVSEFVPEAGVGSSVLVWAESDLPVPPGGADPRWIVSALGAGGIKATTATSGGLAQSLKPSTFGTLVLPYGAAYPYDRRSDIIDFCRAGGRLLILGGYPMNLPLVRADGKWIDWRQEARRRMKEATRWPANLLPDGGFEKTTTPPLGGEVLDGQWHRDNALASIVTDHAPEGKHCGFVEVGPDEPFGQGQERKLYCWIPAQAGHEYHFSCLARSENIHGEGFAYAAVYQYRGDKLAKPYDVIHLRGTNGWEPCDYQFTTDYGVDRIFIKVGIYQARGKAWFDKVQIVGLHGLACTPLNTATGTPGDGLEVAAYQMGMCDADYRLRRVARAEPASGQNILRTPNFVGQLNGWVTSGVLENSARWEPLINTYDRFGRLRGAAGAMLLNYAGFYAGSQWAYFGAENHAFFGPKVKGSGADLVRLVKWLQRSCYLSNLKPEFFAYDAGATVKTTVRVDNFSSGDLKPTVEFSALSGGKTVATERVSVSVRAGSVEDASASLKLPASARGVVTLRARLLLNGSAIDQDDSGTLVRDSAVVAAGPKLDFRDNYFRLNGRPMFLFGSDNYSVDYNSTAMNPARWNEIQRDARDVGLQVYENLQYTNAAHTYTDSDWRKFDAMAQLLQQHGLVFMCGLLIGHNVAVDDTELAAESKMCAEYAARYAKTPSMLWYINGDFQLRYDNTKWLKIAWNQWLRDRYGTDAALAKAWGMAKLPAALGDLPFPPPNQSGWGSRVEVDRIDFNVWLMKRWISHHVKAIHSKDSYHAITSEYYQQPFGGIDLRQTIDGHDASNFGFFSSYPEDLRSLPECLAMNDERYVGKADGLGEYGCKTHPAWSAANNPGGYHVQRTQRQERQLFMTVAAYGLGMGAAKVQNWCLRDSDDRVFPWGIFYPGPDVPKDIAYTHRDLSMMWRMLGPRYQAPAVSIVSPTPLRNGNDGAPGNQAVFTCAQSLLRLHLPFNTIDDFALGKIPTATRTLVWPSCIAESDRALAQAMDWVKAGGNLVLTGLPAWDDNRRSVGTDRLSAMIGALKVEQRFSGVSFGSGAHVKAELGGKTVTLTPQAAVSVGPDARVVLAAEDGTPIIVAHKLGAGTVVWIADPTELRGRSEAPVTTELYRAALAALPKPPAAIEVTPNDPRLHVMRQRTASGYVWVVYPIADDAPKSVTIATPAGPVELGLQPMWPSMVQVTDDGRVLMAMCDGGLKIGDQQIVTGGPILGLASLDGADLRRSKAVMLYPFDTGKAILKGLPTSGEWGDWLDGKWRSLAPIKDRDGRLSVDYDLFTCAGLLSFDPAHWRARLTAYATDPWTVPGY